MNKWQNLGLESTNKVASRFAHCSNLQKWKVQWRVLSPQGMCHCFQRRLSVSHDCVLKRKNLNPSPKFLFARFLFLCIFFWGYFRERIPLAAKLSCLLCNEWQEFGKMFRSWLRLWNLACFWSTLKTVLFKEQQPSMCFLFVYCWVRAKVGTTRVGNNVAWATYLLLQRWKTCRPQGRGLNYAACDIYLANFSACKISYPAKYLSWIR